MILGLQVFLGFTYLALSIHLLVSTMLREVLCLT